MRLYTHTHTHTYIYIYIYIILKIFITHFILYIFKTVYNFKVKWSINKYFSKTCTVLTTYNSKLTTDNTTIADISYKEK